MDVELTVLKLLTAVRTMHETPGAGRGVAREGWAKRQMGTGGGGGRNSGRGGQVGDRAGPLTDAQATRPGPLRHAISASNDQPRRRSCAGTGPTTRSRVFMCLCVCMRVSCVRVRACVVFLPRAC